MTGSCSTRKAGVLAGLRALTCALIALLAGCGGEALEPEKRADGEACQRHGDCRSGACVASACVDLDEGQPDAPAVDPEPSPEGQPEGEPGQAPEGEPEGQPAPTPEGEPTPAPEGEPTPAPEGEPEGEPEPVPTPEPEPDVTPEPVDCGPLGAREGWRVCRQGESSCEGIFTDGAGCAAFCQAAGLACGGVFEDLSGQCAPDLDRPELPCAPGSGHGSDYCVCVAGGCAPQCEGRACGSDGCGGRCGGCEPDQRCVDGACLADPGVEDCQNYPFSADALLAERVGFGRRATGGDPARVYRVTTRSNSGAGSLRAALEADAPYWIVFDVEGEIRLTSRIQVRSNKTVDGRGRSIVINGNLALSGVRNVIVADVGLTNDQEGHCTQDGDVVTIQGRGGDDPSTYEARDIWFHHVELFNGGDGLFDLRGATDVTLSWSHLHTHKKAILAWKDRDNQPTPGMQVTFHHNFFDRISLRGPQFIYGKAHFFNNYQYHWYEYGAGGFGGAQFYSEANIYEARPEAVCLSPCPDPSPCGDSDFFVSKLGLAHDWDENGEGYTRSEGDLALNEAELSVNRPERVFSPAAAYSYSAEPATEALAGRIRVGAGPRAGYCR